MTPLARSGIAAAVLGLAGAGTAWLFVAEPPGRVLAAMVPCSGIAGALVGGFLYRVLASPPRRTGLGWAPLAGALTGLAAHPVAWYLYFVRDLLPGGAPADRAPFDLGSALLAAFVATPVGWLFSAWLTVPAGALAGLLLAVVCRPKPAPPLPE